jgi:hypothetical protein
MSDVNLIVTGVIVGSASGLGGTILGAWVTARSERAGRKVTIEADKARAKAADKRQVYAQSLSQLVNAELSRSVMDRALGAPSYETEARHKRAMLDCTNKIFELALIAPEDIGDLGLDTMHAVTASSAAERADFGATFTRLFGVLREDLGERPFVGPLAATSANAALPAQPQLKMSEAVAALEEMFQPASQPPSASDRARMDAFEELLAFQSSASSQP